MAGIFQTSRNERSSRRPWLPRKKKVDKFLKCLKKSIIFRLFFSPLSRHQKFMATVVFRSIHDDNVATIVSRKKCRRRVAGIVHDVMSLQSDCKHDGRGRRERKIPRAPQKNERDKITRMKRLRRAWIRHNKIKEEKIWMWVAMNKLLLLNSICLKGRIPPPLYSSLTTGKVERLT